MFKSISIVFVLILCGCSVQRDRPDFVYPALQSSTPRDWPKLKPSAQLARENNASIGTGVAPNAILASRIARLRAKATALSAYRF